MYIYQHRLESLASSSSTVFTKAPSAAVQLNILAYVCVGETHLTNQLFAFKQLPLQGR